MEKIVLLGAGGHCRVIMDAIRSQAKFAVAGIIGRGCDSEIKDYSRRGVKNCFIAVGSIGNPEPRIKLSRLAKEAGMRFPNIAHARALVSESAALGEGNYIAAAAIVNAGAEIGSHCIINTGAIVEHDCRVGDFAHIAPRAVIGGGVIVGKGAHIGMGAIVMQGIRIGAGALIGAGSVVVKDIAAKRVAFGNPCREKK